MHTNCPYFIDKIINRISIENVNLEYFTLNFLLIFLVELHFTQDPYKNSSYSSVNLSMSYTKGILNNIKSYVNVTRKHSTTFSYYC
jgi:Ni,Fe-hydrogenase I cytochrome b subunit